MKTALTLLSLLSLVAPALAQCETDELTSPRIGSGDDFGWCVAIDGKTVVVGAPGDDDRGTESGACYVYDATGVDWSETRKIEHHGGDAGDRFGHSVDIDGEYFVAGAPHGDGVVPNAGMAHVYKLEDGVWSPYQRLFASDGAGGSQFGCSVAISGSTIVVGAWQSGSAGMSSGSAYVFELRGTAWVEEEQLVAPDAAAFDLFGNAVAIDGDTIAVGTFGDDDLGPASGGVHVYSRQSGQWLHTQKLLPATGGTQDLFGSSVALRGDTLVVGATGDDDAGVDAGAAFVFDWTGTAFEESVKLFGDPGAVGSEFGASVAISSDESTVAVGAPDDLDLGVATGAAYLFPRVAGAFGASSKLVAQSGAAGLEFGHRVAIELDDVIVGAPETWGGTAYAYSAGGLTCPALDASPTSLSVISGGTQKLDLQPGPGWEDHWYWVVGSASGTTPGVSIGGQNLPLNLDPYLLYTALQPNQGPLVNTLGTLDSLGRASAQITLPAGSDPVLSGLHLDHAYVLWDPWTGGIDMISETRGLDLLP
jgi:hypothetical protein